jgi:hypothetical protein
MVTRQQEWRPAIVKEVQGARKQSHQGCQETGLSMMMYFVVLLSLCCKCNESTLKIPPQMWYNVYFIIYSGIRLGRLTNHENYRAHQTRHRKWRWATKKNIFTAVTHSVILKRFINSWRCSCCSYQWDETTSLNCGHQRAYCSSQRWYMIIQSHGGMILGGENGKKLGENPAPVPLCLPQKPHGLTGARSRASAVRGWRLWQPESWHGRNSWRHETMSIKTYNVVIYHTSLRLDVHGKRNA